jgi:hypothetical protein
MKTIELVINALFILGGLALLGVTFRYPRTVFIDIPLAIIKFPFYVIKEGLLIGFFLDLFGLIAGTDVNNEYKTKRKRYLTFNKCHKFLLTTGTDNEMVRTKVIEGIDSTNEKLKIEDFRFLNNAEQTITLPPADISFHDFNYLIQFLTDGPVKTVGLVENKRLAYTVYDDPDTTNLIGQTDQGEKFFISLADNFDKRQFLRIHDEIELVEEYNISRIKSELSAQQATIHINHAGRV